MTRFIQSGILPLQSYIHGNFFKKVILLFRTVSETFCQLFSETVSCLILNTDVLLLSAYGTKIHQLKRASVLPNSSILCRTFCTICQKRKN